VAADSSFRPGPCLRVSGIGIAQTQFRTLLIMDRSDNLNTYLKLPSGEWAYAEEVDLQSGRQRGLAMLGNAFCSTGLFTRNASGEGTRGTAACLCAPCSPAATVVATLRRRGGDGAALVPHRAAAAGRAGAHRRGLSLWGRT